MAATLQPAEGAVPRPPRERLLFDHGAETALFDATVWQTLDIPHDWSIESKIDPQSPMGGSGGYFQAA